MSGELRQVEQYIIYSSPASSVYRSQGNFSSMMEGRRLDCSAPVGDKRNFHTTWHSSFETSENPWQCPSPEEPDTRPTTGLHERLAAASPANPTKNGGALQSKQ
ncbi:Wilms tumor protein like, partial [Dissostichus eleginoides]